MFCLRSPATLQPKGWMPSISPTTGGINSQQSKNRLGSHKPKLWLNIKSIQWFNSYGRSPFFVQPWSVQPQSSHNGEIRHWNPSPAWGKLPTCWCLEPNDCRQSYSFERMVEPHMREKDIHHWYVHFCNWHLNRCYVISSDIYVNTWWDFMG